MKILKEIILDVADFSLGFLKFSADIVLETFSKSDGYYIGKNYNDNMNTIEAMKELKK